MRESLDSKSRQISELQAQGDISSQKECELQ